LPKRGKPSRSKQRYYQYGIVCDPGHNYLNLPQVTDDEADTISWIDSDDLTTEMTYTGSNVCTVLPEDHPVHEATTVQIIPNLDFMVAQQTATRVGDDLYKIEPSLTFHSVIGGIESMRLDSYDFTYAIGESHICYRFSRSLIFREPLTWTLSDEKFDFWTSSTIIAGNRGHLAEIRKGPYEVVRKQDGVFICLRILNGTAYYYTRGKNFFFTAKDSYPVDRDVLLRFEYVATTGVFYLLNCTVEGVVVPEVNAIQRQFAERLMLPNVPVPALGNDNEDVLNVFTQRTPYNIVSPQVRVSSTVTKMEDHYEGIVVRPLDGSTSFYFKTLENSTIDLDYSTLLLIAQDRSSPFSVDISRAIRTLHEQQVPPTAIVQYSFDCTPHATDLRSQGHNPKNCPIKARAIARLNRKAQLDAPMKPFTSAMVYKLVFDKVRTDKNQSDTQRKFATVVDVSDLQELMNSL